MSPEEFIAKWRDSTLTERSASQAHFLDLCELLEVPKPQEGSAWMQPLLLPKRRSTRPRAGLRERPKLFCQRERLVLIVRANPAAINPLGLIG